MEKLKLTGPQLRTVRYYLQHRHDAPTWAGFFRRFARALALWSLLGVAGSYLSVVAGLPMMAFLLVGLLVGATLREARYYHHMICVWPAIAAIVDWDIAQELSASQ